MNNADQYRGDYFISTDKTKLDISCIHQYLSTESYWAKNIPMATVKKSIDGSACFGLYKRTDDAAGAFEQVGFARVITDNATFGYLADVFILEQHRGQGLGIWLMEVIMNNPDLQDFRRWMLATRDAHSLYARFGFKPLDNPGRFMRYSTFDSYPAPAE